MDQHRKWCKVCQAHTLQARPAVNHVLHLLLTLFTCSAWAVVWLLLLCFQIGGWRCQTCGYTPSSAKAFVVVVSAAVILFVVAILIAGLSP